MPSDHVWVTDAMRLRVWDLPLRLFHWLLVAAIAVAFLSAEEESALNDWHVMSGWIAGLLLVFRLIWGVVGGEHSRFASFIRPREVGAHVGALLRGRPEASLGHNPLGAVSVIVLLILIGATVVTGVLLIEEPHELIGWTLLAMIALPVLAVVAMSILERENLVRAMIDGTKPAARHPGRGHARPPGFAALAVALALSAGAAWAVTRYDPDAFTLRSAESYEHGRENGGGAGEGGEELEEE